MAKRTKEGPEFKERFGKSGGDRPKAEKLNKDGKGHGLGSKGSRRKK